MKAIIRRKNEILIFLVLMLCYGYFFPRWADPNQNSRLDMVFAVVEDGTFQIDRYVENTVDYAMVDGHYYSDKAPGIALLGIPVYKVMTFFLNMPWMEGLVERLGNSSAFQSTLQEGGSGIYVEKVRFAMAQVALSFLLSAVPSALLGVQIFTAARRISHANGLRWAVVVGYGLLTPAFAYANAFYGHQLAAFLLFTAFTIAWAESKQLSALKLIAIGALLSYAFITEYPAILVSAILFVYTVYRLVRSGAPGRTGWLLLPVVVFAAGWMAYNNTVFGGPFSLGYSASTLWAEQHGTGFMSLTLPSLEAAWGISFGLSRGLFLLSPLLLLAIPGLVLWFKSGKYRAEAWVCLLSLAAFFLFNASSVMWWGGFSVGPRYLLPALPFAALAVTWVFAAWGRKIWSILLAGLLYAWSLAAVWGMTLAGQAFPPDTIANPFSGYLIPNWEQGNIARNLGTIFGFKGVVSLVPLLILLVIVGVGGWLTGRKRAAGDQQPEPRVI